MFTPGWEYRVGGENIVSHRHVMAVISAQLSVQFRLCTVCYDSNIGTILMTLFRHVSVPCAAQHGVLPRLFGYEAPNAFEMQIWLRHLAAGFIILYYVGRLLSSFHVRGTHVGLTHLPLNKMAAISQATFSDAFSWIKSFVFWLKFHWTLDLRV